MEAILPDGAKLSLEPESTPDTCPVCHQSGTMTRVPGAFVRFRDGWEHQRTLQLLFRCPRHKCGALFVGEFDHRPWNSRQTTDAWEFRRAFPAQPEPPAISAEIQSLSPSFAGLYKQALAADHHDLTDVFGMALRKALEFLIKDYAITQHPAEAAAIKSTLLGAVIKKYVSDPNIKACAERATWLGNDETHYERRWVGHDVTDLRTLIQLTLNWITNEQLTKKYLATMKP